ncbi:MAG: PHP domain-containing protein [Candidatus Edwardsbacteria bacterium]|nr:PHP domain-containing protein [Candidatus Edwardsbacteria bacterium]MBU1577611.1 PHP domain-containing protein [Candidatus Edwardsbacteria bacterium]MBU2462950.1 PHP domain-containing protein [Candidatus Edwardsbacteria bacterium]MBU2595109.1 PHP domain-containing protein [Candidatus Edwardsbacteria bacterium]
MGKADLHIHTVYSDGSGTVEEVLRKSISAGLGTIAITDHNEIEGAVKAQELAGRWGLNIDVIIGEEITTSDGHVVGLFLKDRIRPLLTAEATVDEIHRQGGLAVAVHPFSVWLKLFKCGGVGSLVESLQFDAIETVNGSPTEGFSNAFTQKLNTKLRLAGVGGSDAHTPEAIGQGYTVFPGRGSAMLYSAIRNKAVQAKSGRSAGKALWDFLMKYLWGKMALYGPKGGAIDQMAAS